MQKDLGAKMSLNLVKSEAKMKQKFVESWRKLVFFGSVFEAQRYRNDSDNFSFFSTHSISQA